MFCLRRRPVSQQPRGGDLRSLGDPRETTAHPEGAGGGGWLVDEALLARVLPEPPDLPGRPKGLAWWHTPVIQHWED